MADIESGQSCKIAGPREDVNCWTSELKSLRSEQREWWLLSVSRKRKIIRPNNYLQTR